MNNYLLIIVGPTAIGKTALAIQLAQHFNCDIVSCDSRQFYKEMEIGTAVPTPEELSAAPHHFIQNKSIFDDYNVGDYEKEVIPLLDSLFFKNNIQIVVGGSGLYVDAILKGFDDFPDVSTEIKEQVENGYATKGIAYLQNQLKNLDPTYYHFLAETNPQTLVNQQRMKRFVGVSLAANAPYSSFLNQEKNKRNFTPIVIGLEAPREEMYHRINLRVDIMMQKGLLKEVADLKKHQKLNALQTVGYRESFDYLDEALTLDEAIEEIKKNTRRFAKRQLTWFKRNEQTKWFSYQEPTQNIIKYINEFTQ
ncbi:tRNA (adenosine(37)-N6)-dimethylallyltransferase MiaA [Flavobacterium sp. xlx-214]|uniref:tRNA (adenosine(37)-N6)-dimethylallyltransferase MiaA n=1 Tax=unclassified Flavobacterium TaxID=196869 RepID=UPI0013D83679|nr:MULTISPECIES: tRNA (adenosine(37)-N6)-dimethylallyltransferase MiaA [unclassified Flavobacterium]MBA5791384.1 tRNA (adenosine(37)-N6)-dimethylallyltransferase MiaA [Flavobacterium sp. xlx-221]QMI83464.1 tRNA (adenosine(37)-N6)-dimethylallyltransferase MiaA [Flavobacterium sp. xlx-214]